MNIGGKGTVADMGFVVCVQIFDHRLMMASIRYMLMGLGGFMVRHGGNFTVSFARIHMRWKPRREEQLTKFMICIGIKTYARGVSSSTWRPFLFNSRTRVLILSSERNPTAHLDTLC